MMSPSGHFAARTGALVRKRRGGGGRQRERCEVKHVRNRWVPTDEFLTWVELDTCSRATVPRDQRLLPLIACC